MAPRKRRGPPRIEEKLSAIEREAFEVIKQGLRAYARDHDGHIPDELFKLLAEMLGISDKTLRDRIGEPPVDVSTLIAGTLAWPKGS